MPSSNDGGGGLLTPLAGSGPDQSFMSGQGLVGTVDRLTQETEPRERILFSMQKAAEQAEENQVRVIEYRRRAALAADKAAETGRLAALAANESPGSEEEERSEELRPKKVFQPLDALLVEVDRTVKLSRSSNGMNEADDFTVEYAAALLEADTDSDEDD